MSSSRSTLHGVDPNENASPLKHRIGDVIVNDGSSILGNEDYVDVELETETVITRKPRNKHRKTFNSIDTLQQCSSSGYSADYEVLIPTTDFEESQGPPVSHDDQECAVIEGNSSFEDQILWNEDVTVEESDGQLESTTVSSEFLEIEVGDGECHFAWVV